jgi:serine/threonine protein kinase
MSTRFCERCERVTVDGNLWCQDTDCPAETGIPLFGFGDYLGEIKILKLISVWRTAAVYEGQRGGKFVWVKVAHRNDICELRLKREAEFLRRATPPRPIGVAALFKSFFPKKRPVWLPMLPAFFNAQPNSEPWGAITVQGATRCFFVFEPVKGSLLRSLLLERPDVWHLEAAVMVRSLQIALDPLVRGGRAHLNLIPDVILVDFDREGHWRPTLLDYGWLLDQTKDKIPSVEFNEPGYSAPEVMTNDRPTLRADVYSLGMLYYEMLSGHAGFETRLRRDRQVMSEVRLQPAPLDIKRPELEAEKVVQTLRRAISPKPVDRYETVTQFAQEIEKVYGSLPAELSEYPIRNWVVFILVMLVIVGAAVALVVVAGAAASQSAV